MVHKGMIMVEIELTCVEMCVRASAFCFQESEIFVISSKGLNGSKIGS